MNIKKEIKALLIKAQEYFHEEYKECLENYEQFQISISIIDNDNYKVMILNPAEKYDKFHLLNENLTIIDSTLRSCFYLLNEELDDIHDQRRQYRETIERVGKAKNTLPSIININGVEYTRNS